MGRWNEILYWRNDKLLSMLEAPQGQGGEMLNKYNEHELPNGTTNELFLKLAGCLRELNEIEQCSTGDDATDHGNFTDSLATLHTLYAAGRTRALSDAVGAVEKLKTECGLSSFRVAFDEAIAAIRALEGK